MGKRDQPPSEDRSVSIEGDNNGVVITGDVNAYIQVTIQSDASGHEKSPSEKRALGVDDLRQLSNKLLKAGAPPSLIPRFPDASILARESLAQLALLQRTVSKGANADQRTSRLHDLVVNKELHHLVTAPPGSGKTHAFWHFAAGLLHDGEVIPLFLPVAGLSKWDDVAKLILDIDGDIDVHALLRNEHICVVIDGWSHFALDDGSTERARAIRLLTGVRLIANGRQADHRDTSFCIWSLDDLPVASVRDAIVTAFPDGQIPESELTELLRLPLALNLYILLGGSATTRGQLLSKLHDALSHGIPASFRDVLSQAAASVSLSRPRGQYSQFQNEIRARASTYSLQEPLSLLQRLGTLEDRGGLVVPIHDLYWSWLVGLGLLADDPSARAFIELATRESYELALQSGAPGRFPIPESVLSTDIFLGATLTTAFNAAYSNDDGFERHVRALFADERLAVRCRAAQAALHVGLAQLLPSALKIVTQIHDAKLYVPSLQAAINPAALFPNRGIVYEWVGNAGTEQVTEAIANRGDAQWGPWFQQLANAGKLSVGAAAAAALACEARVSEWTVEHLPEVAGKYGFALRALTNRGGNVQFARWLAEHYEEYVERGNSRWYHLNKALVACCDDSVVSRLLERFPNMPPAAQETLAYAIVDIGEPWIARFQERAFCAGDANHHYRLKEVISLDISDETARSWISRGITETGWRVLIARHGNRMILEMIALLPTSFDGIATIPVLDAMRFLIDPPASLADEIWKRVRGTMRPKAMHEVIAALARFDPRSILHILGGVSGQLLAFPTYHLNQFLNILREWEAKFHFHFMARTERGDLSLSEWLLTQRLSRDGNDYMFRRALAAQPNLVIRLMVDNYWGDDSVSKQILTQLVDTRISYQSALYERLIGSEVLASLIPKLFARSFDTVPDAALQRALDAPGVNFNELVRSMAASSSVTHIAVHRMIVRRVLATTVDLFVYRELAKMLRVHARESVLEILKNAIPEMTGDALWLVREIETARGELLVNEQGTWLH
jgi:hypothetical protein